jgi:hypothetical protein
MRGSFKKRDWFIVLLLILLLIASIFIGFFYRQDCKTRDCFIKAMFECKKASFISIQQNITWQYNVKGSSDSDCIVSVRSLNVKIDPEAAKKLENKEMDCYIPKKLAGSFMPEAKIEYCRGLLKEGLQDLIIEKMHIYILQNIGQFNKTAV